jgi:hypothetical protein
MPGKPYHKWQQQSRVGIDLGKSPQHVRLVALVLCLETGLVSPQFHVVFDPSFCTVKELSAKSQWQIKAGFVMQPSMLKEHNHRTSFTQRFGLSANMYSNSKGAPHARKRKRKSQGTNVEGKEVDPETRKERAPAAARSTNNWTSRLTSANGSSI